MNNRLDDANLVCIWPLRTPPTEEDLLNIWEASSEVRRRLTEEEVLAIIKPQGRA